MVISKNLLRNVRVVAKLGRQAFFVVLILLLTTLSAFAGFSDIVPKENVRRVGILPGTFDPPHRGHEAMIKNALEQLDLDELIIIPNFLNEKKLGALPFELRREMTVAAMRAYGKVVVADFALAKELNERPLAISVNEFAKERPGLQIVEIVGEDVLEKAKGSPFRFEKNVVLAVEKRSADYIGIKEAMGAHVVTMDGEPAGLSSTKIRQLIASGQNVSPAVLDPAVMEVISRHGLYGPRVFHCSALFL